MTERELLGLWNKARLQLILAQLAPTFPAPMIEIFARRKAWLHSSLGENASGQAHPRRPRQSTRGGVTFRSLAGQLARSRSASLHPSKGEKSMSDKFETPFPGGLKVRAPVKSAGVLVGRVEEIRYDNERFQAEVVFTVVTRTVEVAAEVPTTVLAEAKVPFLTQPEPAI